MKIAFKVHKKSRNIKNDFEKKWGIRPCGHLPQIRHLSDLANQLLVFLLGILLTPGGALVHFTSQEAPCPLK
jgi:hypothetical protein